MNASTIIKKILFTILYAVLGFIPYLILGILFFSSTITFTRPDGSLYQMTSTYDWWNWVFYIYLIIVVYCVWFKKKKVKNNFEKSIENKSSSADELIKYKELLDQGIISQEEFDAKKKQTLEL